MKKVLFSFIVCIISLSASAQIVDGLVYPATHFGIRGSLTSNSINANSGDWVDYDEEKALNYISGGVAADFLLATIPLYLETGLYYVNRGFKYKDDYYDESINDHSIVVPVLMSYHLYFSDNMSVQPFVGPYVGYGIDMERVDYGLRSGIGWNLGRLYLNVGYDMGFKVDGYKNNTFFASIGFNFGGSY